MFASDDGSISAATFSYTLSSAAIWKGPIKNGKVTLIVDTLYLDEFQIEPRDRFARKGNKFTWSFKSLEPTAATILGSGFTGLGILTTLGVAAKYSQRATGRLKVSIICARA